MDDATIADIGATIAAAVAVPAVKMPVLVINIPETVPASFTPAHHTCNRSNTVFVTFIIIGWVIKKVDIDIAL